MPVAVGLDMDRVSMEMANDDDLGIDDIIGSGPTNAQGENVIAEGGSGGSAPNVENPNSVEYNA